MENQRANDQGGWQTAIAIKVERLAEDVTKIDSKLVGKTAKGWHKPNMRAWARELQSSNPALTVPVPKNDFD